jgi:hypothetical protein
MLLNQKIDEEAILKAETWVSEEEGVINGFFSYDSFMGVPYLIHFLVDKPRKRHSLFRRMAKKFKDLCKEKGSSEFIINVPVEKEYVRNFVQSYLKTEPYAFTENQYYFLGGV